MCEYIFENGFPFLFLYVHKFIYLFVPLWALCLICACNSNSIKILCYSAVYWVLSRYLYIRFIGIAIVDCYVI